MRWSYQNGVHSNAVSVIGVKIAILMAGLVIGFCAGMYVAVRTLPLPSTTVTYITK